MGSISSELLMCGGGVRSIFIFSCGKMHRDNRCMYIIIIKIIFVYEN